MKISIDWLKELVDLKVPIEELIRLLPLRTIGLKEATQNYIELDMKGYNRADLLSLRGVAYEVGATLGSNTLFSELQEAKFVWNQESLPQVPVDVLDSKLCPFYCIAKIEGLKVEKSPAEWVKKLEDSGMRSVNNIADITNLVMLEYGQPLHAFDAKEVENEEIIVRTAKNGEELVTLDGKKRKLSKNDLLIADSKKALGLAGVMGGQNSEVTADTSTILLEAAIFDPINLRQTVTSLGLPSEAGKRFQHGLTKLRLLQALNAAIRIYRELDGKLTAISIVDNFENQQRVINLSLDKLNALVGINFDEKQVEKYLSRLYFKLHSHIVSGNVVWDVTVPYWRLDINIEEDLIEEVARLYGYEKIPAKALSGNYKLQTTQKLFNQIKIVKDTLVNLGLTEIQTYSFYSTRVLNNPDQDKSKLIRIANPMSLETEYLRESIWPNLLEVIDRNTRQGFKDIAIFEIGKVYSPKLGDLPNEGYRLSVALMNGSDNPIEELISILLNSKLISESELKEASVNTNTFHPKRFASVEKHSKQIGFLAEVHPRFLNKMGIDKRVAMLEIDLTAFS